MALFCVISVHFFRNIGFYEADVNNIAMFAGTGLRTLFMVCVPLFLIITGYLMCHKRLEPRYYKGMARTYIIYLICAALCGAYRFGTQDMPITLQTVLVSLFGFEYYSWYIEMYIGLFLIIPFLNIIYNSLESRAKKRALIFTCLCLTSIPGALNYYCKITPEYWAFTYPVLYYFMGAYIREYEDEIRAALAPVLFVGALLAGTAVNVLVSYGKPFVYTAMVDWGGIENALMAPALFVILKKLPLGKTPKAAAKCIEKIGKWSLGAYLLSWIFDQYAYPALNSALPTAESRMIYYPVMVLFVLGCSLVSSAAVNGIYSLAAFAMKKVRTTSDGVSAGENF